MVDLVIKLLLAPGLMSAATLATRRGGPRWGGIVGAFPAIVGPLLLVTTLERGAAAASAAAGGILLGLVGLAAFVLAYGRTAGRRGWRVSLLAGWAAAALGTAAAGVLGGRAGWWVDGLIATAALLTCWPLLGVSGPGAPALPPRTSRRTLLLRAGSTAVLVVALSAAVGGFGATVGGLLAALPVLTSLLAVFTHREAGSPAAREILRGTIAGMTGFVAFCALVAAMIVPYGPGVAFTAASAAALLVQGLLALVAPRRAPADRFPARRLVHRLLIR